MANENMRSVPIQIFKNGKGITVGEVHLREDGGVKGALSFDSPGLNSLIREVSSFELVPVNPAIAPKASAGYTSHGHHIPGMPTDNLKRSTARCGGPGLCALCSIQAGEEPSDANS